MDHTTETDAGPACSIEAGRLRCLAYLKSHGAGEVEGLFGPQSVVWEIYAEPLVLLATPSAVLMQFAHPAIAAGVGQHSNFQGDLLGRTQRTFLALYELVYGSMPQVRGMFDRLHALHLKVRGRVQDPSVRAHGSSYRAHQQELMWWVSVTFAHSVRQCFELMVRPLTEEERDRNYQEMILAGAGVGVTPEMYPPSRAEFEKRFDAMFTGGALQVGEVARGLCQTLLTSPLGRGPVDDLAAAALLPPALRGAYDLPWGALEQRAWQAMVSSLRASRRLLPPPLRHVPAWHQAHQRIAAARGERAPLLSRSVERLGRHVGLPLGLSAAH